MMLTGQPRYAPPGKHVALLEEMAFPASWRTELEWREIKKEAPERFVDEWGKYAPNMIMDNVIGANIDTPFDTQHRGLSFLDGNLAGIGLIPSQSGNLRPIPEFAQYQIPGIENFWMGGPSQHSTGCVCGWSGYNCYKRMAQKYDLWKPWEGRLY